MFMTHNFGRGGRIGGLAAVLLLFSACTSVRIETAPDDHLRQKVHWSFQKEAVTIRIQADKSLNRSDGRSHTLVVGVLQLRDPNGLLPLAENPDRAMETLAAGRGGPGILEVRRFVVSPGAAGTLRIDRLRHARYVGVIAGYSDYSPKTDTLLRPLSVKVIRSGFIFRSTHDRPAPAIVQILLGSRHLLGVNMLKPEHKTPPPGKKETPATGPAPGIRPLRGGDRLS